MIELNNIEKSFQTDFWVKPSKALNDLSFTIEESKIVGFLGANGAGKTTTIKMIMGFISQDKGKILYSDSLGKTRNEILSNIGFIPERPYFYPHLTGSEFLSLMGKLSGLKKSGKPFVAT